jgi:adenylate cyclase class 2
MGERNKELEVKYYVSNLENLEKHLVYLGATLVQPRTLEENLLFDKPDGKITENLQVLCLRRNSRILLKFKGPGEIIEGVQSRIEIEFSVRCFNKARRFLEALNYRVRMVYEKFRSVFDKNGVHVAFDELPYGNFVEIEGLDPGRIRAVINLFQLKWEERISSYYSRLFRAVCVNLDLTIVNLTL